MVKQEKCINYSFKIYTRLASKTTGEYVECNLRAILDYRICNDLSYLFGSQFILNNKCWFHGPSCLKMVSDEGESCFMFMEVGFLQTEKGHLKPVK